MCKIDCYFEYGFVVIFLFMCLFILIVYWLVCVWYVIGWVEVCNSSGWLELFVDEIDKLIN